MREPSLLWSAEFYLQWINNFLGETSPFEEFQVMIDMGVTFKKNILSHNLFIAFSCGKKSITGCGCVQMGSCSSAGLKQVTWLEYALQSWVLYDFLCF